MKSEFPSMSVKQSNFKSDLSPSQSKMKGYQFQIDLNSSSYSQILTKVKDNTLEFDD